MLYGSSKLLAAPYLTRVVAMRPSSATATYSSVKDQLVSLSLEIEVNKNESSRGEPLSLEDLSSMSTLLMSAVRGEAWLFEMHSSQVSV